MNCFGVCEGSCEASRASRRCTRLHCRPSDINPRDKQMPTGLLDPALPRVIGCPPESSPTVLLARLSRSVAAACRRTPAVLVLIVAALGGDWCSGRARAQTPAADPVATATALIREGRYSAAIETLKRAMPAHPADPKLPTVEGIAYSLQGDDAHALECLHRALDHRSRVSTGAAGRGVHPVPATRPGGHSRAPGDPARGSA